MLQQFFKDYFSYSKKERTGIIVLLFIIVFTAILPFTYPLFIHPAPPTKLEFQNAAQALNKADSSQKGHYTSQRFQNNQNNYDETNGSSSENAVLFEFDPNTASAADWKKLGIRDKAIHTIQNYLSKEGTFIRLRILERYGALIKKMPKG